MRKLLATILAVALAMVMVLGTALADETVLGDGNGDYTKAITEAPEGSELIITAEFTSERVTNYETGETTPFDPVEEKWTPGWGVGGISFTPDWAVDGEFEYKIEKVPVKGDVVTITYKCDELKKASTGEIKVNLYNGFFTRKVVLKTPAAADGGDGKADGQGGDAQGDGKGGDAPKTADTMTVVLFAGIALLALGAVVVTKKARA